MKIIKMRENTLDGSLKQQLGFFSKTEADDQLEKTMGFVKYQNIRNGIDVSFFEKGKEFRVKRNGPDISSEEKKSLHWLRKNFRSVVGDYLVDFVCPRVTGCSMYTIQEMYDDTSHYLSKRIGIIHAWLQRIDCLLDNIDFLSKKGGKVCLTKESQARINWGPILDYLKEHIIASKSANTLVNELRSSLLTYKLGLLDIPRAAKKLDTELRSISIPDQVVEGRLKHDLFKAMHKQLNDFDVYLFETVKTSLFSVIKQPENISATSFKTIFTTQRNTDFNSSYFYHHAKSTTDLTRADIQLVERSTMRAVNSSKVVANYSAEWVYFAMSIGLVLLGAGSLFFIYTLRSYLNKRNDGACTLSSTTRYKEERVDNSPEYSLVSFSK